MLTALSIRDVVLISTLDLEPGAGLIALTGETGAGKSIVLDALGLATGARADSGLVRREAGEARVTAAFTLPPGHGAWSLLAERDIAAEAGEDLVLRRQVSADGRSRAYVNDQPVSVGVLRDLGALLLEVHGQHDAVGLLDPRTHRALLDAFGSLTAPLAACRDAWAARRAAEARLALLQGEAARRTEAIEEAGARLAELDRLDPRPGEEQTLADTRTLLGAAEKIVSDIGAARDAFAGSQLSNRLAQGLKALERARDRTRLAGGQDDAGAGQTAGALAKLDEAIAAAERTAVEAQETLQALDAAARAFVFEPAALETAEERLFALRAMARKLGVAVDDLAEERQRFAALLLGFETAEETLEEARRSSAAAVARYVAAAAALSAARQAAAVRLSRAVEAELAPLKLDKARFRVAVAPLPPERHGPEGADRVAFEITTNPGAPFGPLGDIASGGELARLALALKVALATRTGPDAGAPTLVFDEVDQGVGGAVADAVGLRLKRLAATGQVLVVTHSPQVAARADVHWRVAKAVERDVTSTSVVTLDPAAREEEIARMLAGAQITDAARAAARALIAY
jgi:DNA repair protein RecN (Recombination protein N)